MRWNGTSSCRNCAKPAARRSQRFAGGVENLGVLLCKHLPATGENPNELPDAPRFELK